MKPCSYASLFLVGGGEDLINFLFKYGSFPNRSAGRNRWGMGTL